VVPPRSVSGSRSRAQAGRSVQPGDVPITDADILTLRSTLARIGQTEYTARPFLDHMDYPLERRPAWTATAEAWWIQLFDSLGDGVSPTPYRRLLEAARERNPYHPTLQTLVERYLGPLEEPTSEGYRVIVLAPTEPDRERAMAALASLGPQRRWCNDYAESYELTGAEPDEIHRLLSGTGLTWEVVAPGEPDYLIHHIFLQGPDGRRLQATDTPAAQRVGDLAADLAEEYPQPAAAGSRPAVMDLVETGGARRRLDPAVSLHTAGVTEQSTVRIGFEGTAGAVNPLYRQDALVRVRNQIAAFAAGRPHFDVQVDYPDLPNEYELTFRARGFGPPPHQGAAPEPIDEHSVLVELGGEFPETPPVVFWLTPVFHPNVAPNYGPDAHQYDQGRVCLGLLESGWFPALDFAEVCQTLVDIAAYRNYDLVQVGDDGQLYENFYNLEAARWVVEHQQDIEARGGRPRLRPSGGLRFRNAFTEI
jgi:hypothetical protein